MPYINAITIPKKDRAAYKIVSNRVIAKNRNKYPTKPITVLIPKDAVNLPLISIFAISLKKYADNRIAPAKY